MRVTSQGGPPKGGAQGKMPFLPSPYLEHTTAYELHYQRLTNSIHTVNVLQIAYTNVNTKTFSINPQ